MTLWAQYDMQNMKKSISQDSQVFSEDLTIFQKLKEFID